MPPSHSGHVFQRITISQKNFEKGYTRNNLMKLFQILTSVFGEDFFKVHIMQNAPIHHSHAYLQIKLSQTIFEKGHQRNIPLKRFQNLTSSFREDFLKIFCKKPPFTRAMLMDG